MKKELLEEKLLRSDFTFGFELEGCAEYDFYGDYDNEYDEETAGEDDNLWRRHDYQVSGQLAEKINSNLNNLLNKNIPSNQYKEGTIGNDDSLYPTDSNDFTFEWASPVLECTPMNFARVIRMLYSLDSIGIYTNDDCGIHHHLSYNGMTERDMIWIYVNLCMDQNFREYMSSVDDIDLTSDHWALDSSLKDIKKAIEEKNYTAILAYLSDDKYRLFRIHPQGTLEWRGPRDFLNENNLEIIKDFYKKFNTYINKIIEYQDNKTIFGTNITKKEFFDNLTIAKNEHPNSDRELEFLVRTHNYHDQPLRYKTEKGIKPSSELIQAIYDKPKLLYKLIFEKPDVIKKIYLYDSNAIEYATNRLYDTGVEKPKEFAEKLFDIYISYVTIENALRKLDNWKSYINYNDLIKKYGITDESLITLIAHSVLAQAIDYKQLYNYLVKIYRSDIDLTGATMRELYTIIDGTVHINWSSKEKISVLNVIIKIAYKNDCEFPQSWIRPFQVLVEDYMADIMNTEQIKQWNNSLIAGIYSKPYLMWMAALLNVNYVDIKSIIALCSRYPDIYLYLDPMLKRDIKPYLQKGIADDE